MKGVLDKEEVILAKAGGLLQHAHVVVGTPACLAEVLSSPQPQRGTVAHCKVVAVDEVDLCFQARACL